MIQQFAKSYLENNFMLSTDADKVIEFAKGHAQMEAFLDRWHDHLEGYPPELKAAFIYSLRSCTVEWIDANMPKAWFRAIFLDEV